MRLHKIINILTIGLTGIICILLLICPEIASNNIKEALNLCGNKLIPSLFPMLVISTFFTTSNIISKPVKPISFMLNKIFSIPENMSAAALLGFIAGYPVCAACAGNMYKSGKCTKEQAEYTCAICSNPSLIFMLSTIGLMIFSSRQTGLMLILSMFISTYMTSLLLRRQYAIKGTAEQSACVINKHMASPISALLSSITQSVFLMLKICGFVLFFCVAGSFINYLLNTVFRLNNCAESLIHGFFEISGGVFAIDTPYNHRAATLCSAICGWSGLSVLFQILEILHEHGLSVKPYIKAKILNTLFFPLTTQLLLVVFKI